MFVLSSSLSIKGSLNNYSLLYTLLSANFNISVNSLIPLAVSNFLSPNTCHPFLLLDTTYNF